MMTKICYVNVGKILQVKVREFHDEEDDDDEEYNGGLNVRIWENGEYVVYHFSDPESLDNFLFMLEEDDIPYDLIDDEGNVLEVDEEFYYDDEEDDMYD